MFGGLSNQCGVLQPLSRFHDSYYGSIDDQLSIIINFFG
jgi:hypothetical protein